MERKGFEHGTVSGYGSHGCRCDECRAAWAEYHKARRGRAAEQVRVVREIEQVEEKVEAIVETGDEATIPVPLSPLGLTILANLQRQTNLTRREIFERFLRDFGGELAAADRAA